MRKAIAGALIGLIAGAGIVILNAAPAAADTISPTLESGFVAKINALRATKGLGQLAVHDQLVSIGRNWAQQMANVGEISHNPNFPNQVTVDWKKLGENVGRGGEIDSLFQAFVNSPAHYANLVDPAFNYVGVGVVVKPDGTMFTSHQFMQAAASSGGGGGAPAPTAPKAAPTPRPTSAPRATTPRQPAAPRPAAAATAKPAAAPTPPPPPPVPPARIVLSLEMLQGKAAA